MYGKRVLILILIIILNIIPIYSYAYNYTSSTLEVYFHISTIKQKNNFVLGPDGIKIIWNQSQDDFFLSSLNVLLDVSGEYDEVIDKISTNGFINYVSSHRDGTTFLIQSYPGEDLVIKTKDITSLMINKLSLNCWYEKVDQAKIDMQGDLAVISYNMNFTGLKSVFGNNLNFVWTTLVWNDTFDVVSIISPSGRDLVRDEEAAYVWNFNSISLSLSDLNRSGYLLDGNWVITGRKAFNPFYKIAKRNLINAKLYLFKSGNIKLKINPGEKRVIEIFDILHREIPKGYSLIGYLTGRMSGDVEQISLSGVSYLFRFSYGVYKYLYFNPFGGKIEIKNNGNKKASILFSYYYQLEHPLNVSLYSEENNPNIVTATFNLPYFSEIPKENVDSIALSVINKGYYKALSLIAPNGKRIEKVIERKRMGYLSYYYTRYSYRSVYVSLKMDKQPFSGTWIYKVKIPTIIVRGLHVKLSKPRWGNILDVGRFKRGYYSIGEKVQIRVKDNMVNYGNKTRIVFKAWRGSGEGSYTGSDPIFTLKIEDTSLITEEAIWVKEYLVSIKYTHGKKDVEEWYPVNSKLKVDIGKSVVQEGKDVRYVFQGWTGNVREDKPLIEVEVLSPIAITARWKKQYYVTVVDKIGESSGEGWYDEDDIATISTSEVAKGFPIRVVFSHWLVNGRKVEGKTISIIVNSPTTAIAVWKKDFMYLYLSAGLALLLVVFAAIFIIVKKKKKTKQRSYIYYQRYIQQGS